MQQATQLPAPHQLPPNGLCFPVPQPAPGLHDKLVSLLQPPGSHLLEELANPALHPQPTPSQSKGHSLPAASPNLRMPRLRAMVESQAFKNILVDEMDLMLTRAATLIQANWRGYQLRQKLLSQMSAAKAIQEAWRRFNTRRLLRSSKSVPPRRAAGEEGDANIPYHAPQQVRFQPLVEECLACQPVMVNKETQCPSSEGLGACTPQPTAAPGAARVCVLAFPQPTVPRLTGPLGLEQKFQTSLLTKTVRNTSVVRQMETEVVKTKPGAARSPRAPEPPPCGRGGQALPGGLRVQTQAPAEPEGLRPPPQLCPTPASTKTFLKAYSGLSAFRPPVPSCRAPPQKCAMPAPDTAPTVPRPPAHTHLLVSLTSTATQTRPPATLLKAAPPVCLLSSDRAPRAKAPTTPGPAKTTPQVRLAATPAHSPAAGPSKSSSQTCPAAGGTRPPPQARLAAMLTRTPAHIRNVAAVLKTLCLVHPTAGTLKTPPPAASPGGVPSPPQPVSAPRTRTTANVKPTVGTLRVSSQSLLLDGKTRAGPQPQVDVGAPRGPAKASPDAEKTKSCAPKHAKPSMTLAMTAEASWTKVAEGKPKPVVRTQQRTEVIRVRSRLLVPVDGSVALPLPKAAEQPQMPARQSKAAGQPRPAPAPAPPASCLAKAALQGRTAAEQAKALCQAQLTSCLSRPHAPAELTVVLPDAYPATCPPAAQPAAHLHAPGEHTQVLSQATRLIKVSSQLYSSTPQRPAPCRPHAAAKPALAHTPTKLAKSPSLAHLVTCLARARTHSRGLAGPSGEVAKGTCRARPPSAHLGAKAQSHPTLASSKASPQTCQDLGPRGTMARSQSEGRAVHVQTPSHAPGPSAPGPCTTITDAASVLVPLLASAGCICNMESWGDSGPVSGPQAPPSQVVTCPEDVATSQMASLCTELAAVLGSQEDLRCLLARALSQGEVRAALNQALGPAVAKALPQGLLGTALTKALSWGELGVTLTRVLSRGELRAELAKAMQGKLADLLSKALSEEERLALSQALCPGEPGAVFGQAVARRPAATTLPKAPSKPAGSRMTVLSAPGAVDCRMGSSPSWGAAMSPSGRLPPHKVRAGRGVTVGVTASMGGMGDGAPWWGQAAPGPALSPLLLSPLLLSPSWGRAPLGEAFPDLRPGPEPPVLLHLCPARGASSSLVHLDLLAGGEGPLLPKTPRFQPPPSPGCALTANGAGPSSGRPPAGSGSASASPRPPVTGRVAPRTWTPAGEGSAASLWAGGRRAPRSPQGPMSPQGSSCWCQSLGAGKVSPILCTCSVARCLNHLSKVTEDHLRRHRQASPRAREGVGAPGVPQARAPRTQTPACADTGRVRPRPRAPGPRQEKSPRKGATATLPCSRGPSARAGRPMSLLDELVTGLPRHPQDVLGKRFKPGSAGCREDSESHSSAHSSSSFSPWSVASASELPEGRWVPDPRLPPRDWAGEGSADKAEREDGACPAPETPRQPQAPAPSRPCHPQALRHGAMASHLESGLHRASGGESEQKAPATELPARPREPGKARLWRSLSLGSVVPVRDLRPDPSPPTLVGGRQRAPLPGTSERPGPSGQSLSPVWPGPDPAQPTEPSKWPLGCTHPPMASGGINFVPPPTVCGGVPNFVQPPVGGGLFPAFYQPCMVAGGSPNVMQPPLLGGGALNFVYPSIAHGGSPNFPQPSMAGTGSPNFVQPCMASGVPSTFVRPPMACVGLSNFVLSSLQSGGSSNFSRPSMADGGPPSCPQPSTAGGGPPNFVQPSMVGGSSANFSPPSVVGGGSPDFAVPPVAGGGSPILSRLSMASNLSSRVTQPPSCLRASPRLTPAFLASGSYPGLPQLSVATLGALSLVQPSVVFGVGHSFQEPALAPRLHPDPGRGGGEAATPPQSHRPGPTRPGRSPAGSDPRVCLDQHLPSAPLGGGLGPGSVVLPQAWPRGVGPSPAGDSTRGQVTASTRSPLLSHTVVRGQNPGAAVEPHATWTNQVTAAVVTGLGRVLAPGKPAAPQAGTPFPPASDPQQHSESPAAALGPREELAAPRRPPVGVAGQRPYTPGGSVAPGLPPGSEVSSRGSWLHHGAPRVRSAPTAPAVTHRCSMVATAGVVTQRYSTGTVAGGVARGSSLGTVGSGCPLDLVTGSVASSGGRQRSHPPRVSSGLAALSPPGGSMLVGISPRPYQVALSDGAPGSSLGPLAAGLAQGHPRAPEELSGLREGQAGLGGQPAGTVGGQVGLGDYEPCDRDPGHQVPPLGEGLPSQASHPGAPRALGPGATGMPHAPHSPVAHRPTGHLGTASSNAALAWPRPTHGRTSALDLPLGPKARVEALCCPWRPTATAPMSPGKPQPSSSLMAAAQEDSICGGTQKSQGPEKPQVHRRAFRAPPCGLVSTLLREAGVGAGQAPASTPPTSHPIEGGGGLREPSAPPRIHRVSMGYVTTSSGSWKLLDPDSRDTLSPPPAPATPQAPSIPSTACPLGPRAPAAAHLTPTVLQGPVEAVVAGGSSWNPVATSRPADNSLALGGGGTRESASGRWATVGSMVVAEPGQPGPLVVSMQAVENVVIQAVVTIQACARGYLVRRAIKVWHHWATVIQATWRGHRVRRNLAQLYRATTVIQAAWRGYCTRRERARRRLLPVVWAEPSGPVRLLTRRPHAHLSEGRLPSDHRCFLSCQPDVCSLCQALSPGLPAPPSVVMLVGSSPRTCHMCGHTLATRVVQGVGRSAPGQESLPWAWASQGSLQLRNQNKAATAIQSAWRGFRTRCLLRRQQLAAKVLQSTWRGHYTRSCLTTDALLGLPSQWDPPSRNVSHASRWPGV